MDRVVSPIAPVAQERSPRGLPAPWPRSARRRRISAEEGLEERILLEAREIGVGAHLIAIGDAAGAEGACQEFDGVLGVPRQGIRAGGVVPGEGGDGSEIAGAGVVLPRLPVALCFASGSRREGGEGGAKSRRLRLRRLRSVDHIPESSALRRR